MIWPTKLGLVGVRETLAEEEKTDRILSDLAEATINAAAEQQAA